MKILVKYIFFVSIVVSIVYPQTETIFLSSEKDEVKVISYSPWFADSDKDFEGVFQMIVPSDGESDGQAEKLKLTDIHWSDDLGTFTGFVTTELEVADWSQFDTIRNCRISCEGENLTGSSCSFKSEEYSGEFVILKFKTARGKTKETKGLLITRLSTPGYKFFYEKISGTSGGFSERNSILLFGKNLVFGISSTEFINTFTEFTIEEPMDGFQRYRYGTNYDNAFANYWMTAKFQNDKLVCFEFNGWQTDEYMKIIDETLKQFKFDKTVIDKDEDIGDTRTDYYHKEELKAEYFSFETSVLTICLSN